MREIGYSKPLFVQPFDHRGSFTKGFFGIHGEPAIEPDREQFLQVSRAKMIVYRGLLGAIELGVPRDHLGILIDTQFGGPIIANAKARGVPVAVCVERTGKDVFDFEYGGRWVDHIRFVQPNMVKVLVRFHPQGDPAANAEQLTRLKLLSDYIHSTDDQHYMFELLVPATTPEEKEAGSAFDTELRPRVMVEAIRAIQEFGVEPDIWKIEGLDHRADAEAVSAQARSGRSAEGTSRENVGCILLGRGSNQEQVYKWLTVAAPVAGFIGFAVGRTNFAEPLKSFIADSSQERAAVDAIAKNFKGCVDTWEAARRGGA